MPSNAARIASLSAAISASDRGLRSASAGLSGRARMCSPILKDTSFKKHARQRT